jgi:hypothetical protein
MPVREFSSANQLQRVTARWAGESDVNKRARPRLPWIRRRYTAQMR